MFAVMLISLETKPMKDSNMNQGVDKDDIPVGLDTTSEFLASNTPSKFCVDSLLSPSSAPSNSLSNEYQSKASNPMKHHCIYLQTINMRFYPHRTCKNTPRTIFYLVHLQIVLEISAKKSLRTKYYHSVIPTIYWNSKSKRLQIEMISQL